MYYAKYKRDALVQYTTREMNLLHIADWAVI